MAKLKYLKLPKKPKQSASVATLRKYLDRVADIKKENQRRASVNAEQDRLKKQVAAVSGTSVMPGSRTRSVGSKPRKRKAGTATKRKATRKKTTRRR